MTDKKPPATDTKPSAKSPKARAIATVDAEALYPLPPSDVDEKSLKLLSEATYGDKTVRVVTDGKSVWKEVA